MTELKLWNTLPGPTDGKLPQFAYYAPAEPKRDAAVVIYPGGGYVGLAEHEGKGYAEFLAAAGYHAFVCKYRVKMEGETLYPWPLLDGRRAVRWVRAHAEEYGIDPHKIAVMGSSAGGHLAAMVSAYTEPVDGEKTDRTDEEDCLPNATVICYGVTDDPFDPIIRECYDTLVGSGDWKDGTSVTPAKMVNGTTPPAFLWHTSDDPVVNVIYCYRYAAALRRHGIPHEVHVFPRGSHGLGLASGDPSVGQWSGLLLKWMAEELGW